MSKQKTAQAPATETTQAPATETTQAPATLGPTDTAAIASYAVSLDRKFGSADLLVEQIADDAGALALLLVRLGAGSDFAVYTACRTAYIAALTGKSADAAARSWQRAYAAARDTAGGSTLPKGGPAAATPDAVRVAAKRAEGKAAAAADTRTAAEIKAEALKLAGKGDLIGAGKLAKLAESKIKAADRDAKQKAREATKAQADQIRAAISRLQDAGNVAALAAILKLALKHSPEPVKAAA